MVKDVKSFILKRVKFAKDTTLSWDKFCKLAIKTAKHYQIPSCVIIGQAALETGRGISEFALKRNNYFGIAAFDSNPDMAITYATPLDSIIAYCELISNTPRYKKAYEARFDPLKMLALIHQAGYASDPEYVTKITSLPEWKNLQNRRVL